MTALPTPPSMRGRTRRFRADSEVRQISLKAGSMALRREATTWFRSGFVAAVIPPPCPPGSVLHSEPLGWSPELVCPRLTAAPGSAPIARALSHFPWPAPSQDAP